MTDIRSMRDAYRWNISRIAAVFNKDRGVVRRRLREAGVQPAATRQGINLYDLSDVAPALFPTRGQPRVVSDPDDLDPMDRKSWYHSENLRLEFERKIRGLVTEEDYRHELSAFAATLRDHLAQLPEMLEQDVGLDPEALAMVATVTDALRAQLGGYISDDEPAA
ncbi:DUF1441 family protein [Halomonas ramblicola]|uniref:DUF1441 family protein n=1 Tax=Halomonas ramblicola TaxID=747349 RepID=UPI0025B5A993|nr:DUF1441 family protein [Halomonas ramblicola]MDN3521513.1 DUF1441 family protein [Halomonas ramblicola]